MTDHGPPRLMRHAGFSVQGADKAQPNLPATLRFDASILTKKQCMAWLATMLPRLAWKGAEENFDVVHNRVLISNGTFSQYRIYGGGAYPARTYQVRRVSLKAIAPDGISQVRLNPALSRTAEKHWSFTVTANARSPWQREFEVWDEQKRRVASRGTYAPEWVTFRFADAEGASRARAVFQRLVILSSHPLAEPSSSAPRSPPG